jgi:hypothetical protein
MPLYLNTYVYTYIYIYTHTHRVGHEKVARLPFCTCPCYCINFRIYAMLRTWATFSWSTPYVHIQSQFLTLVLAYTVFEFSCVRFSSAWLQTP